MLRELARDAIDRDDMLSLQKIEEAHDMAKRMQGKLVYYKAIEKSPIMRPLIFAACDSGYYEKYAKALSRSAREHGMECIIRCSGRLAKTQADKNEHNVMRYRLLPDILKDYPAVLVLDVDSIINEPIELPERYDLGIFFRPDPLGNLELRKKVLGSAFYITAKAMDVAEDMRRRMSGETQWFDDQIALYRIAQKYGAKYQIKRLFTNFINWHCQPASIWTGKGDVKETSPIFKRELARWAA